MICLFWHSISSVCCWTDCFSAIIKREIIKRIQRPPPKGNDFQDFRNSPLQYFCPDFQINPTPSARRLKTWVPLLMPKLAMGTSFHMHIPLTSGSQNAMCSPGWKMIYGVYINTFKISPGFHKNICSYTQESPAALTV